ncbi:DUF1963 domain-containing protein [Pseudomonas phytophila]|uniref:DUF1963 domain-containing protein n=1 Tax=Pseudomonas phytophila TaxID=2867264 RepID=A0ABY6FIN9_9PSED|nr:DUF1963 domain-containing protein [Pseudomonas phytophila]UXZ97524.1 DUF1963 domain-containing protein [Pseudomonas phytophila]
MEAQTTQSPYDASLRDHRAEAELEAYFQKHRKTGIVLQRVYPPTAFPKVRSRLGGLPQLPQTFEWPIGVSYGESTPMHFLAQIDCAELPRVESLMPTQGMLFFFAVNDEEQIWDTDPPQERVRVLYAPNVPAEQPERQAPEHLRPIQDVNKADSPHTEPGWLLPGESGPRLHAQWPLVARRMDTWPYDMPTPEGSSRPALAAYHQRWSELSLGAAVAATGLMPNANAIFRWERPLSQSWKFPAQWLRYQLDFPQVGIMIDRLARIAGNSRIKETRSFVADQDVLDWVEHASRIGWDNVPDEATREAFRNWIIGQIGDENEGTTITDARMGEVFTKGLLASIAYVAGSPDTARLIPLPLYRDVEGEHLPYEESYRKHADGRRDCARARVHQMLGHVPLLQGAMPDIEGEPVCLLQLAWDPAIDLRFGDCGQATFWIAREDLAVQNFDRVAAVVESH